MADLAAAPSRVFAGSSSCWLYSCWLPQREWAPSEDRAHSFYSLIRLPNHGGVLIVTVTGALMMASSAEVLPTANTWKFNGVGANDAGNVMVNV